MEVTFSDKYNPLFELLDGKYPQVNVVNISGGRDSGKSFALGIFVSSAAAMYDHRILFTRQTMSSTNNSITRALDNRMELMNLDDMFTFANNDYEAINGKGMISITGQKTSAGTQTAKLKSLEGYSMFITEEAEELTNFEDWDKIKRSIRAPDVQCLSINCFNPPTKAHWLFEEFYQEIPQGFNGIIGNVMYIHTTYLDNGKDNMALHNWEEYERLRKVYEFFNTLSPDEKIRQPKRVIRDYKNYKNTILGGFRDSAEGVIFDYKIGEFIENDYQSIYGMDQGFNDPTTLIKVSVDKKNKVIYLKEVYYEVAKTETDVYNSIKDEVGIKRIWCDSAVPMFIKGLQNRGLNIKPCDKPKIKDSIHAMLDFELVVTPCSTNLIKELQNYKWSDKKQDEPIDAYNHCIDAARYAITHKLKERQSQVL